MPALTEAQQAWVDALRSGNYRQGRSYLRDEQNRYCCLGVACEVAREHGVKVKVEHTYGHYLYNGAVTFPPLAVTEWLGLASTRGEFNVGSVGTPDEVPTGSLFGLNDHFLWGFDDIADLIEQRPQGLFMEEPEDEMELLREDVKRYEQDLRELAKPETEIEF